MTARLKAPPRRKPRKSDRDATTLKISVPLIRHIEAQAKANESIDRTLRRLFGFPEEAPDRDEPEASMRTIKVSRPILEFVSERARPRESRDETLRRLLKMKPNGHKGQTGS